MIGSRGVLATFLAVAFIASILFGFKDKLARNNVTTLCKSAETGAIDFCARSGGLSR